MFAYVFIWLLTFIMMSYHINFELVWKTSRSMISKTKKNKRQMFAFASEDTWSSQEMILEQFVAEALGFGLPKRTNQTDGAMFGSWNYMKLSSMFVLLKGDICYIRTDTVCRFCYCILRYYTTIYIYIHTLLDSGWNLTVLDQLCMILRACACLWEPCIKRNISWQCQCRVHLHSPKKSNTWPFNVCFVTGERFFLNKKQFYFTVIQTFSTCFIGRHELEEIPWRPIVRLRPPLVHCIFFCFLWATGKKAKRFGWFFWRVMKICLYVCLFGWLVG